MRKYEGPLPKMMNSPADGTNVSLPLGCKSPLWPIVEDLFTNHANGPGSPPTLVPSVGLFNILFKWALILWQSNELKFTYWSGEFLILCNEHMNV